jgi:hypothetical protein
MLCISNSHRLVGNGSQGGINYCYSTGSVVGSQKVGGLIGSINFLYPLRGFWDVETSGQKTSAGGTGRTSAQMKNISTYTSAGWDFVGESTNGTADTWRMCANDVDYPRLSWENSQGGDFDCPNGVDLNDLLYLSARWLGTTPTKVGAADATFDGKVNLADFAILSENWLQTAP